ncbi:MAG TPA: PAS domain S-box protein [Smithella sp.]|nr:PAS domain S-box protein [Smithella sp.]HOG91013.1 PAS domain S-box protein [Smithella sp.]
MNKLENQSPRKSEKYFRDITENFSDIFIITDQAGHIKYCSRSAERHTGYKPEEMIGRSAFSFVHPDDVHRTAADYATTLLRDKKALIPDALRIIHKNGSIIYLDGIGTNLLENPDIAGMVITARDITKRKQTEEELLQSEAKFRAILESIKDGYYETDREGKFTFLNDSLCRILERSQEELLGTHYREYLDENYLETIFQESSKVYQTGKPIEDFHCLMKSKDGTTRDIEVSVSLIKDISDHPSGFKGFVRDISEHKKIEKKLKNEEQIFRSLADQSSDIILLVNRKGIITYENKAVHASLGYRHEERIGASSLDHIHPDDVIPITDAFRVLFSDRNAPTLKADVRLRKADGNWRTFELVASNLVRGNVVKAAIINLRDITERKQTEEKLQQTLNSLKKAVSATVQVLVSALEARDPYTAGHQFRSANLACAIGKEMGLTENMIEGIRMAGTIHDIGKMAIPTEILTKPSKLTHIEYTLIKEHSKIGYEMLKGVESSWPLAQIVHQHHERMDGTGYPRNMKGEEILLEARVMAVADVVEAMASHRPYRPSLGIEFALEEIEKNKGILYDDVVADACLKLFREKEYRFS